MSVDVRRHREGAWSLDEFVGLANELLPDFLPKESTGRASESVNQRLVRHYATQGLLDEPLKEGREARYLYRHLLQMLALRRLLAEGFSSTVVKRVMEDRDESELEGLLSGRLRIDLVPQGARDDERARFLRSIRARAGLDAATEGPAPSDPRGAPARSGATAAAHVPQPTTSSTGDMQRSSLFPPGGVFRESTWTRLQIEDGLELLVRADYRLPDTRLGDNELMQLLKVTLLHLEQKQRGKP